MTQVGEPYFDPTPPAEKFDRTIRDWQTIALGEGNRRAADPYVGNDQTLMEAFDRTITADVNLVGDRSQKHERFIWLHFQRLVTWEQLDQLNKARRAVYLRIQRRLFFTMSGGRFGLGPWDTKAGDIVFVLLGCNVPVILRPDGERWVLVGEAFVLGIMDGEMAEVAERDGPVDSEDVEHDSGRIVESVLIS